MSERILPVLVAAVVLATPVLSGCLAGSSTTGSEGAADGTGTTAYAVANGTVSNVTASSATVRFEVTGDPVNVTIRYGRNLSRLAPAPDVRATDGGYAATLRGLPPNTSYVVVAEAADDGARLRSAPVSFTTAHAMGTGEIRIRPGILYQWSSRGGGGCALGFILESMVNGSVYALTAGHCFRDLGENATLYLEDGTPFANVAAYGFEDDGDEVIDREWVTINTSDWIDWGLVKIRPAMVPHVSAKVTHWTGPTGVSAEGALAEGDLLCYYGYGGGVPGVERHRCASFWMYDEDNEENQHDEVRSWTLGSGAPDGEPVVVGWTYGGDSGGPVVDYRTGEAVGIASHVAYGQAYHEATALYDVMDILEDRGYDLELATADWDPPPANPIPVGPLP